MVQRYSDAVVIGAGMGGIYQAHRLVKLGLTVKVIEDVTPLPHNGCRPPKKRRV